MDDNNDWMMRIEGAMNANFLQEDGASIPGTEWAVGLKNGDDLFKVMVRTYLADDVRSEVAENVEYQGQTVLGYVWDMLQAGWTPDQELSPIVIGNPREAEE
ncbi:MAG: hypothetical protein K2X35_03065 [Bryobacteraceae bacterium]|nr:hypothetical protein [Bryobacteraceae bacterium]